MLFTDGVLKIARALPVGSSGVAIAQVTFLRGLTLGMNACTGLITAAVLGAAGRGDQAALTLAPQVLAGVSTLGLHASLIYNVKADPEHEREYIGINLLLAFFAGLASTAIGWILLPIWLVKYSNDVVDLARWFLLVMPFMTTSFTFKAVLEARAHFGLANQPAYFQSICTLVVLGVLGLMKDLTPATAAASYICPYVLSWFCLAVFAVSRVHPRFTLQIPLFVRLLHYGLRFYGVDVLGAGAMYLDQIIVAAMLPPTALGVYVVGLGISRLLSVLPTSAGTVLFPTLAAKPTTAIMNAVAKAVRVFGLINLACVLVLALFGSHLLVLLYGPRFAAASTPLIILLFSTVPANAVTLFYQSYSASGRPGMVTIIHGTGLAVSLGVMLLLVPTYGTTGAALALLFSGIVRLALVLLGLPLILKVRVPRLLVSRSDFAWVKGH